ncbi:MAG: DUF167 domain-containing protein [Acidobacteriota bacterium]|nr:DUF167 domain-containing protein [Acidobacteriota bacterium]
MDLDLSEHRGGTRLRLRVKPGARSDAILGAHGGALKLSVSAAPEKGKANVAVCALIAGVLGLPASAVEIVAGRASRDKTVWIALPPEDVGRILSRATS